MKTILSRSKKMKKLIAVLLMLLTVNCYADITAKIISIEKEKFGDDVCVKVTTEYTYPDGYVKQGVTRYNLENVSKAQVVADIKAHLAVILRYYISENRARILTARETMIDNYINNQSTSTVGYQYTLVGTTDAATGTYMPATGTIPESYK